MVEVGKGWCGILSEHTNWLVACEKIQSILENFCTKNLREKPFMSAYQMLKLSCIKKIKVIKNSLLLIHHPSPSSIKGYRMLCSILRKILTWQIWCTYATNTTENKFVYSQHILILHTITIMKVKKRFWKYLIHTGWGKLLYLKWTCYLKS